MYITTVNCVIVYTPINLLIFSSCPKQMPALWQNKISDPNGAQITFISVDKGYYLARDSFKYSLMSFYSKVLHITYKIKPNNSTLTS